MVRNSLTRVPLSEHNGANTNGTMKSAMKTLLGEREKITFYDDCLEDGTETTAGTRAGNRALRSVDCFNDTEDERKRKAVRESMKRLYKSPGKENHAADFGQHRLS